MRKLLALSLAFIFYASIALPVTNCTSPVVCTLPSTAVAAGTFITSINTTAGCGVTTAASGNFVTWGIAANCGTVGTSRIIAAAPTINHRNYLSCQSKSASPTSGDRCGWGITTNSWRSDWNPAGSMYLTTDATITNTRLIVGFADSQASSVVNFNNNATSVTVESEKEAYIEYDTGGSAPTTDWFRCTSTGGGGAGSRTCTDTGIVVVASTEYLVQIFSNDNGTTWTFVINGTVQTTTTTVPLSTTQMFWGANIITLTTAQKLYYQAEYYVISN